MKIPEHLNIEDPETKSFLRELIDVAGKTREDLEWILKNWEPIQKAKEENPNSWWINK